MLALLVPLDKPALQARLALHQLSQDRLDPLAPQGQRALLVILEPLVL